MASNHQLPCLRSAHARFYHRTQACPANRAWFHLGTDPALLGLFGLSFIGLGIFLPDPVMGYPPGASSTPTVQGTIHNIFGQLQFISLIAACFVLARRDAAEPTERGWVWYSIATGLLVAVSDVVFVATVKLLDGGPGPAGLISRLGIVIGWSWIALLAIRLNLIRRRRKIPGMPVG